MARHMKFGGGSCGLSFHFLKGRGSGSGPGLKTWKIFGICFSVVDVKLEKEGRVFLL